MTKLIEQAFELAKQRYAALGIDVDQIMTKLDGIPVSMHCWQGDDVRGFENPNGELTGGIQATGNYPGRARNADELRADIEKAMSLIPGAKRLNLHAIYLESDTPVERDAIEPKHFSGWVEWAKANKLGLDFNPSCFSHPLSADGFTLSHADKRIRQFWIDHCKASRRISAHFGEQLGTPSVMNIWVPDGMKDLTIDRLAPRERLASALDEVISEARPPSSYRCGGEQTVRYRRGELHRGLQRVLPRLRRQPSNGADVGRRTFPSNRSDFRQDIHCHAVCAAFAAARQPPGTLG